MKGLCRMIWLELLMVVTFGHAVAQSSGITRLRQWLSDRQKKEGFQQDTAYIDTLNTLAHAYYVPSMPIAYYSMANRLWPARRNSPTQKGSQRAGG